MSQDLFGHIMALLLSGAALRWGPADSNLLHLAERGDLFDVCRIELQRLNQL